MERICRTKEIRKIYATVLKIEGIIIYFSKAKAVLEENWRNWNSQRTDRAPENLRTRCGRKLLWRTYGNRVLEENWRNWNKEKRRN